MFFLRWLVALFICEVQQGSWTFSVRHVPQQNSWTQLNRFAKSSYLSPALQYLPGSCHWSLLPWRKKSFHCQVCYMHHYLQRWRSGKGNATSISKSFIVFGYGPTCKMSTVAQSIYSIWCYFPPVPLANLVLKRVWYLNIDHSCFCCSEIFLHIQPPLSKDREDALLMPPH